MSKYTTADRLRQARKSARLTQVDLAKQLRVRQNDVSRAETIRQWTEIDLLRRWALACGMTLGELLD